MSVSTMTETGLNTVNPSTLNLFQQLLLFVLILLGSSIWVSWLVVLVRRSGFKRTLNKTESEVGKGAEKRWNGEPCPVVSPGNTGEAASLEILPSSQTPSSSSPFDNTSSKLARESHTQEEESHSLEHRAIKLFSWLVPAYFVLWQLLGCLTVGLYIGYKKWGLARANGVSPW